jgi:hypothetical protein
MLAATQTQINLICAPHTVCIEHSVARQIGGNTRAPLTVRAVTLRSYVARGAKPDPARDIAAGGCCNRQGGNCPEPEAG